MKRVTISITDLDKEIKPLNSPTHFNVGVVHHFFVEKFSHLDFARFLKESKNEKTK